MTKTNAIHGIIGVFTLNAIAYVPIALDKRIHKPFHKSYTPSNINNDILR
jgi:hypothetical protein